MQLLMGYAIYLASIIVGLFKKNSKALAFVILIAMWLIMGFNSDNEDMLPYKYFYDLQLTEGSGLYLGYVATEQFAWQLGFDYYQYRMLFSGISLLLIFRFIVRYTDNPALVLALYALLPFMYDVVQFKFFLSASVAITGLSFLIDNKKFAVPAFCCFLLIAILFHPASALFSIFMISKLSKKRALVLSIVLALIILLSVYSGYAQMVMSGLMDSTKASVYLSELGRFGSLPYLVSTLLLVVLSVYVQNEISFHERRIEEGTVCPLPSGNKFLEFFKSGVFAFIPLVALLPVSLQNFYRPIRSSLLLFYLFFAITAFEHRDYLSQRSRSLFILSFIIWVLLTFYTVMYGVYDIVIAAELANNLLW